MVLGWGRFCWLTYISFDFLWWLHELYVTNCHIKQSFYWWLDKRNWCIVGYKRNASWAVVGTFLLAHWNSSDRSTVNGLPWHLSRYSSHVCYNTGSTKGYLFVKHPFIYRSLLEQCPMYVCMCMCMHVSGWLGFRYLGLLGKVGSLMTTTLSQRCNRGCFICYEVKGHIPRSRVMWGQVRWKILVFVIGSPLRSWSLIGSNLKSKMQ